MTILVGPNLGLMVDGLIGESHYTQLMTFMRGMDALVMPRVISATLTTPPASPAAGDTYIVPSGATGAWLNKTNQIARYTTGNAQGITQWDFYVPKKGWLVNINDDVQGGSTSGNLAKYSGSAWVILNVVGAPLDSPTFTGTPTVPTATAGTNTTQIASTAFVTTAVANGNLLPSNAQTGTTYTLALSDLGKCVEIADAAANSVTIPLNSSVAFPIGTVIPVTQMGAGQTTITATSGVTLLNAHATAKIAAQYGSVTLRKTATDTWIIEGYLAAS